MSVRLYAITCGHLSIPTRFMLAGREGSMRVPVTSYLIEHPRGRVLFDSGLHRATCDDPAAHIGAFLARFHEFDFGPDEGIAARLASMEVDPASVTHVVNSHLHFDHCGGNCELPNATVVLQRREREAAREAGEQRGYVAADFETGQPERLVDGEHDLFGDGSVVCVPTYGHTPGHQSLRVRAASGEEFFLCGDACYLKEALETMTLPGVVADPDATLAVFGRLQTLSAAGVRIMYGHDLAFWSGIPQAPQRLG